MRDWDRELYRRIPGKFDFNYAINRDLKVRFIEDGQIYNVKDVEGNVELSSSGVIEKYDVRELWKETAKKWGIAA